MNLDEFYIFYEEDLESKRKKKLYKRQELEKQRAELEENSDEYTL